MKVRTRGAKIALAAAVLLVGYFIYLWQDFSWRQGFLRRNNLTGGCVVWDITQTVAADNKTGRFVAWQSPEWEEVLEVREVGAEDGFFVAMKTEPVLDKDYRIHTVELRGLRPGKRYEYQMRYGWTPLVTDNGGGFRALLFSAQQKNRYRQDGMLPKSMWYPVDANIAFWALIGTPAAADGHSWAREWRMAMPTYGDIPLALVPGNPLGPIGSAQTALTKKLLREFTMPDNGDADRRNQYYSFDFGAVHFAVCNAQFEETEIYGADLREAELAWLRRDLAATAQRWKVVLLYQSPLASRPYDGGTPVSGFSAAGEIFLPIFDAYGVDAVVSGDLHTYRRQQRLRAFAPHPDGTLYLAAGMPTGDPDAARWAAHRFDVAAPESPDGSYMILDADANRLRFTAFSPAGKLLDEVVLEKP